MTWLTSTLTELYGLPIKDGQLGVEIEMEGYNYLPTREEVYPNWVRTMDGSLRGKDNAEYVLPAPYDKDEVFGRLDNLTKNLADKKSRVKDTVRAGVHVHVNVLKDTVLSIFNFLTCYYILEEALTERFCGEGRAGNHFCLRATDGEIIPYELRRALRDEDLGRLHTDYIRYAGCNLDAMFRHGSLEFRSLRTPTDLNRIKTWIEILLSVKEGSKMFANPREIVEQFSMGGEINFLRQMLGPNVNELKPLDDDLKLMLVRGVRLAQEIGYARKEWN